jgi:hypothetical protein
MKSIQQFELINEFENSYDFEEIAYDEEEPRGTDYEELLNEELQKRQLQDPAKMKFIREPIHLPPDDVMWDEYEAFLNEEFAKKQKEMENAMELKMRLLNLKSEQDKKILYWDKVTKPVKTFIKKLTLPSYEEIVKMNTILFVATAIKNYFKPLYEARERAEKQKALQLLLEEQRKMDAEKERVSEEKRIATQKRIQERKQQERRIATQGGYNSKAKKQKDVVTDKGLTDAERTKRNAEKRKKAEIRKAAELNEARKTIQYVKPSNITVVKFDIEEEEEEENVEEVETENKTELKEAEKTQEVEYIKTFASILKKKIETDDTLYTQLKIQKELRQQEEDEMKEYIRGLIAVGSIKQNTKKSTHYTVKKVEEPNEKKNGKISLAEFNNITPLIHNHNHTNTYNNTTHIYNNQPVSSEKIQFQTICNSIETRTACRFGSNCKFVHTFEDLNQISCKHGENCGYVQKVNGEYLNKAFGRRAGVKCCNIHPNETPSNICKRLNIQQKKSQPIQTPVKPQPIQIQTPVQIQPQTPVQTPVQIQPIQIQPIQLQTPVQIQPIQIQPIQLQTPVQTPSNNQEYIVYQQVCKTIELGTKCIHGARCKFVHTYKDLNKVPCRHGENCGYIQNVNGEYVNKAFGRTAKKCCNIHPNETVDNICKRLHITK